MSERHKLKSRDKIILKNTRDGLVERNKTTNEDTRIGKREKDFNLREQRDVKHNAANSDGYDNRGFSQIGKSPDTRKAQDLSRQFQENTRVSNVQAEHTGQSALRFTEGEQSAQYQVQNNVPDMPAEQTADTFSENASAAEAPKAPPPSNDRRLPHSPQSTGNRNPHIPKSRIYRPYAEQFTKNTFTSDALNNAPIVVAPPNTVNITESVAADLSDVSSQKAIPFSDNHDKRSGTKSPGKLEFTQEESAPVENGKRRQTKLQSTGAETPVTEISNPVAENEADNSGEAPLSSAPESETATSDTKFRKESIRAKPQTDKTDARLNTGSHDRLQFSQDETVSVPKGKRKAPEKSKRKAKKNVRAALTAAVIKKPAASVQTEPDSTPKRRKDKQRADTQDTPSSDREKKARQKSERAKQETDKSKVSAPKKLQNKLNRKADKAQAKAERVTGKLEKARDNIPVKRKLRKVSVTDSKTGIAKRKLKFEKTPISQREHIKGAVPLRPVKAAGNTLLASAHRKIYQVEHENVGIKAAHRTEMVVEGGIRSALRFHKTAPYRKVAKLERAVRKKSIKLTYQQTLAQNPKLKSNILKRALQKQKIKRDYAKAAREAQKAAKRAKKAGSITADAAKSVAGVIRRHPIATVIVILCAFLVFMLNSIFSLGGGLGSGGLGGIVSSTYLAEDVDILGANDAYTGLESDLQYKLDNYALLFPGYNEYQFDLDSIWHDPYVLTSMISALHEGAWTLEEVHGTLAMLFERQYTLTETVTVEVRYRTETETTTDPETGETTTESYEVAYNYYICSVTLDNFNLSHLPIYIMGEQGLSRYALLMTTLGNRPDLFPVSVYPDASYYKDYGRHDIPSEYFDDETFAAIIKEAEKYLGMPYVWGGYNPSTSFDCSGFVSWVLNQTGWNIGRLGAMGLYNISTIVPASAAKPGDLIFFHSTYDAPDPNGATHVGIYVGDGVMLHCGNPIGYVSVETAYWQQHLMAYGKIYN